MAASDTSENTIVLRASDVSKTYRMSGQPVHAVNNVTFEVAAGEFVAIMGPSGSGKSTMMNLLGALDRPTAGSVIIDGLDTARMNSTQLARVRNRKIGFVFQQFNLLPRASALQQVMLPMRYAGISSGKLERRARKLLNVVGLGEREDHLPTQLSGGQQQRVAVARALANSPEMILADEPTGALDSKTSAELMSLLKSLNQRGMTLIIVTHDDEVAAHADRQIQFKDGEIISDDGARVHEAPADAEIEIEAAQ